MGPARQVIVVFLCVAAGCSTAGFSSNTGEALRIDRSGGGDRATQIGREQSLFGQQLISSGRQKITAGQEKIRRGERLIMEGAEQVMQSREAYERLAQRLPPEDAQLLQIEERWDAGVESVREGNALISEGNQQIEAGQLEIREGRALMQSAAAVIRSAERTYREPFPR